jgi:4'-phosphopantetheinyl transferase
MTEKISAEMLFQKNHADLWVGNIFGYENRTETLKGFLTKRENLRADEFTHTKARSIYIISRALLRLAGSCYLNQHPKEIEFKLLKNGKPTFAKHPYLHFNISHSQNLVVLLFAPVQCGVDCESYQRKIEFRPILKRFFNQNERKSFDADLSNDRSKVFFRGWTRKEAWLKNTGEGIGGLSSCEISFSENCANALVRKSGKDYVKCCWYCCEFLLPHKYICTAVFKDKKPEIKLKNAETLFNIL